MSDDHRSDGPGQDSSSGRPGEEQRIERLRLLPAPQPESAADDESELELLAEPIERVEQSMTRSASGLEEAAIAPQDLKELQDLLKVRALPMPPGALELRSLTLEVLSPEISEVLLTLSSPRTLKLKIVSLPERVKVHKLNPETSRPRVQHSLELIQRQPLRRRRLLPAELSATQREALSRALFKQYGAAARQLLPTALFAHVPPELKDNLRLSSDGSSLGIVVPKGFNAARASAGHYLVLLEDRESEQEETRRILLRL